MPKDKAMKRNLSVFVIVLAFVLLACAYNASMVTTSYKVLAVSNLSYDTGMKVVADLDKRGLLPQDEKIKIMAAATTFFEAHNAAVAALANYKESEDLADQELLEKQIALVSEAIANLMAIITPYLEK